MNGSRRHLQTGVSLVELAISIVLVVSLLVGLVQLASTSKALTQTTLMAGHLDEAANQTVQTIATELRWADPTSLLVTIENGCHRLDFVVAQGWDGANPTWSTPITVRYEPENGDANGNGLADEGRLVWVQDGGTRTLSRSVQAGSFAVTQTGGLVEMAVTVFSRVDGETMQRVGRYATHLVNRGGP